MTVHRTCEDCGVVFPSKGPSQRCKPCRADHYDEQHRAYAKKAKEKRAQLRAGEGG